MSSQIKGQLEKLNMLKELQSMISDGKINPLKQTNLEQNVDQAAILASIAGNIQKQSTQVAQGAP